METLVSSEDENCTQTEAIKVNLSQLIRATSVKKKHRPSESAQHSETNELSFLVKIGLLVYSATTKKIFS